MMVPEIPATRCAAVSRKTAIALAEGRSLRTPVEGALSLPCSKTGVALAAAEGIVSSSILALEAITITAVPAASFSELLALALSEAAVFPTEASLVVATAALALVPRSVAVPAIALALATTALAVLAVSMPAVTEIASAIALVVEAGSLPVASAFVPFLFRLRFGLDVVGTALDQEAMMDLRVALEVMRDSTRGDVFHFQMLLGQSLGIDLEIAQVAGKDQDAFRAQDPAQGADQLGVIALDGPGTLAHGLGIGESGRIAEDQVVPVRPLGLLEDPAGRIRTAVTMLHAEEAVALHIATCPI